MQSAVSCEILENVIKYQLEIIINHLIRFYFHLVCMLTCI